MPIGAAGNRQINPQGYGLPAANQVRRAAYLDTACIERRYFQVPAQHLPKAGDSVYASLANQLAARLQLLIQNVAAYHRFSAKVIPETLL
ncbi:MAG: hypothetical protein FJ316_09355 [SAR202 cluster bacterium]|nr:hypothetical protein [SAR202 cluster bacterium]